MAMDGAFPSRVVSLVVRACRDESAGEYPTPRCLGGSKPGVPSAIGESLRGLLTRCEAGVHESTRPRCDGSEWLPGRGLSAMSVLDVLSGVRAPAASLRECFCVAPLACPVRAACPGRFREAWAESRGGYSRLLLSWLGGDRVFGYWFARGFLNGVSSRAAPVSWCTSVFMRQYAHRWPTAHIDLDGLLGGSRAIVCGGSGASPIRAGALLAVLGPTQPGVERVGVRLERGPVAVV